MMTDDIFAGFESQFDEVDTTQEEALAFELATKSEVELRLMLNDLDQELLEQRQVLKPKTQEARDIHSIHVAVAIELQKRERNG